MTCYVCKLAAHWQLERDGREPKGCCSTHLKNLLETIPRNEMFALRGVT